MNRFKYFLIALEFILILGMSCALSWRLGRLRGERIGRELQHEEDVAAIRTDTVTVRDTIVFERIVPKREYIVRTDTLYLPPEETGIEQDSVKTVIPIERVVYDDFRYYAVISGWHPTLDTLKIYEQIKTVYKTEEVKVYVEPSRWSVGVQAGYGASPKGLFPYIGVGVQYALIQPKKRK